MPIERYRISYHAKGAWAEDEEWCELVVDTDSGAKHVENHSSFVSPYPRSKRPSRSNTIKVTVEDFLKSDASDGDKDWLRAKLKELGLDD